MLPVLESSHIYYNSSVFVSSCPDSYAVQEDIVHPSPEDSKSRNDEKYNPVILGVSGRHDGSPERQLAFVFSLLHTGLAQDHGTL